MTNLIPVNERPISFTGQYLFEGAKHLARPGKDEPIQYAIGRGLYAWGVVVVAPVGIIYHLGAAALSKIAQSWCDDEKCKELEERVWCHLDAAFYDGMGLGSSFLFGPIALAMLVTGVVLGYLPLIIGCIGGQIVSLIMDFNAALNYLILWKNFAQSSIAFSTFMNNQIMEVNTDIVEKNYYVGLFTQKAQKEKIISDGGIPRLLDIEDTCTLGRKMCETPPDLDKIISLLIVPG